MTFSLDTNGSDCPSGKTSGFDLTNEQEAAGFQKSVGLLVVDVCEKQKSCWNEFSPLAG